MRPKLASKDHASQPDAMFGVTAMTGPSHVELRRDHRPVAAIARGLAYETDELAELHRRLSAAMAKQGW